MCVCTNKLKCTERKTTGGRGGGGKKKRSDSEKSEIKM